MNGVNHKSEISNHSGVIFAPSMVCRSLLTVPGDLPICEKQKC